MIVHAGAGGGAVVHDENHPQRTNFDKMETKCDTNPVKPLCGGSGPGEGGGIPVLGGGSPGC